MRPVGSEICPTVRGAGYRFFAARGAAALKIQHAVRGESWRPGRLNLDLCVDALLQPAAGLSALV